MVRPIHARDLIGLVEKNKKVSSSPGLGECHYESIDINNPESGIIHQKGSGGIIGYCGWYGYHAVKMNRIPGLRIFASKLIFKTSSLSAAIPDQIYVLVRFFGKLEQDEESRQCGRHLPEPVEKRHNCHCSNTSLGKTIVESTTPIEARGEQMNRTSTTAF
ncbi:MAG: hypothetical protein M1829_004566 [Trizodia sp. TS-e1964]|nr:MAG: hypothetical protein M1829_004566 [Trizodia sp. TS-e1964]